MSIWKELKDRGWIEKSGVLVYFGSPRLGYKKDGTLIIGYHEYPKKIKTIEELYEIISREIKMPH